MIAGYLRLSRDEDRKQYVSIENQRLILNQYALANGLRIDLFYEDDNISGYTFERPGMKQLIADIDAGLVDTVLAKDLSRIGRHNAKVLLLIEDFKERNIRLILVNDNYDSFQKEEDDILGIKTWYNERYVKDASRKMKKVLRAKQKEGTLPVRPCFGYEVKSGDKHNVYILESEARVIREIFELYLEGNGYRRIAEILNEKMVGTPSSLMKQRNGTGFNGKTARVWSQEMVRDILKNDFYMGRLRTHVRERKSIHGTDTRVPKKEQYIFENHHEPIIDMETFQLVQNIMDGRSRNNYRGQRNNHSIFSQCIFCGDCGARMNFVRRTKRKKQKYFICRTYNAKGQRYCSAHTVDEDELLEAVLHYLQICKEMLKDDIEEYSLRKQEARVEQDEKLLKELDVLLYKQQKKLEVILEQKISQMADDMQHAVTLKNTYGKLEHDTLEQIKRIQEQIADLNRSIEINRTEEKQSLNAAEVLERVIEKKELTTKDVELLIDRIIVDRDGSFEIKLRYGLAAIVDENMVIRKLCSEKNIFRDVLEVVLEEAENRGYTSAKYMNKRLREKEWSTSLRSVVPFLMQLVAMGVLEKTDDPLRPYTVIASAGYIRALIKEQI